MHWHGIELESCRDGVAGWSGMRGSIAPPIAPGESLWHRWRHVTPRDGETPFQATGANRLATFLPSPDSRIVLYAITTGGSESVVLRVREVATGKDLDGPFKMAAAL